MSNQILANDETEPDANANVGQTPAESVETTVDTESVLINAEPIVIQADPVVFQADTFVIQSDPFVPPVEPTATEPEPVAVSEPVVAEAETVVEAEPVVAETEPVVAETESTVPVAEPAVAEQADYSMPAGAKPKKKKKGKAIEALNADQLAATTVVDPSETENEAEKIRFADLPLNERVIAGVNQAGYEFPTPVQAQIIPYMAEGRDVLAQSQTGSGKTAAFALPILSKVRSNGKGKAPQALVLAPTRELAMQVAEAFKRYAAAMPKFFVAAIYGGQDYEIQLRQLRRGVQVVVGTPGRVIDHVKRGSLDLSEVKCMILDEADEMLNMGFLDDVQFILDQTPSDRQTALFSATMPGPIRDISREYLDDPAKITIKKKRLTADSIRQRALFVNNRDKVQLLSRILEAEETDGVIVFTKTKESTLTVAEQLNRHGFSAIALNGDMPQKVRERAIEQLKSGRLNILVATDVAARGLDVQRISHVINFDLPHDGESYVHRVGRTGRAGRKGEAILFLTNAQRRRLGAIERLTKQKIEVVDPPTADQINSFRVSQFKQQITDMIGDQDLTMFKQLIAQYVEETGKPVEMVAAALAQLRQDGRPFFVKELPKTKQRSKSDRYDRSDDDGFRGKRRGKPRDFDHARKRYRIEVGRRDNATPRNIVGAIANEAGIEGEFIGPIKIFDNFSLVDLPDRLPDDVFQKLQGVRVSGKPMRLQPDRGGFKGGRDGGRGGRGPRSEGSFSGGGGGGKFKKKGKFNKKKRK